MIDLDQSLALKPIPSLVGGMSDSIFVETEEMLCLDGRYLDAIENVVPYSEVVRYASIVDFLFIETNPEYRKACKEFYNDKGPPLRDIRNFLSHEVCVAELRMLYALNTIFNTRHGPMRPSWRKIKMAARNVGRIV